MTLDARLSDEQLQKIATECGWTIWKPDGDGPFQTLARAVAQAATDKALHSVVAYLRREADARYNGPKGQESQGYRVAARMALRVMAIEIERAATERGGLA